MKKFITMTTRIPVEVVEWLSAKARDENRSRNGQLIAELEAVMKKEKVAA